MNGVVALSEYSACPGFSARIERFVNSDAFLAGYPDVCRDLAAAAHLRTLEDGATAGAVGDPQRTITGLVAGSLVLWLPLQDGSLRPLHLLRPGAWLVSLPLIYGQPRRVTFTASGTAQVVQLDEEAVDRLVEAYPVLWRWITRIVAEHLDRALSVCAGLLADRPLPRIAARLLALSDDHTSRTAAIELKQSDLALSSGLSRNTVSRTLGQLEAMGLIARGYRRLRVLDHTGLAQVAAGEDPP
jgi:CRP/FNR family transcriptional regulator